MSHLMPSLSGDVSRILLFLKAVRYGRHEEILPELLLTVKNLSFAPGGPSCGSAPTALDRCVPPPIRPRARWCRACVPILQQLPEIRHSDSHRSANTSIAYEWYSSCFESY